jgi:hypothetical protein
MASTKLADILNGEFSLAQLFSGIEPGYNLGL